MRRSFQTVRRTLAGGNRPPEGTPTLVLDFVPTADGSPTLELLFSQPRYAAFERDPLTGGITNFQVWS